VTRRILHIVSDLQPSGTTTQLKLLAAGLPRDKFELHVAALDGGGPIGQELQALGVDMTVIGRRWPIDPLAYRRLRKHIQRLRPDVVHTWQFTANTYGRAAAVAASVPNIIATERNVDVWKMDWQRLLDRRLARRTRRLVVDSAAVKNACLAHGLPPEKIVTITGAVAAPPNSTVSRAALLAELKLPDDAKLIAFVGQLTKHKRLKELIWATDQLKAVGVAAHLLIIGQGPLRNALERYALLNHLRDRVHFLGVRTDVLQILPHVSVLWQSGDREGHSCAVLEAMAAGIPVVAADAAGNRELVLPGETGFLVPLNERAGFARATLPLLEDAALAQKIGAAGQIFANQHHHVDQFTAAYARLYEQS
jgi:glycosyltransferase involved in cell wall biosynthesis